MPITPGQSKACSHCGTMVHGLQAADLDGPVFCCQGCHRVYHLLKGSGLDYYYQLRDSSPLLRPEERRPANDAPTAIFRDPSLIDQQVHPRSDGRAECRFYIDGMHCAACVWLLEQLPRQEPGIHSSRVQFARHALDLVFDPQHIALDQVAQAVLKLGYTPHPWSLGETQRRLMAERRRLTMRFAVAGASMMATMHLAVNLFAGDITGDLDAGGRSFMGWLSFLTCLPAVTWAAMPYHRAAIGALRARRATLDLTVSLVLLAGFAISTIHLLLGRHDVYFDAMAMFIFFLLGGRLVYVIARDAVMGEQAALTSFLPRSARRLADDGREEEIAIDSLRPGDTALLRPGERIPADGRLSHGALTCDCALLNGESLPQAVDVGGQLHAGTLVVDGEGSLQVEQIGAQTRMGRLLSAVAQAQGSGSAITQLVDRVLAAFAPVVALAALATFLLWWQWDALRAWDQTIAVIIVACPCALGLAAPLIQALSVSRAARQGLLIRDAAILETLASCRHAVLDKTGTLTQASMQVAEIHWHCDPCPQLLGRLASLAAASSHPVSRALAQHLAEQPREAVADFTVHPGQGISGRLGDRIYRLGKETWAGGTHAAAGAETAGPRVCFADDGAALAHIELQDPLRPEAAQLIADLRQRGLEIHLCSGDHRGAVQHAAQQLGIDAAHSHADASPEDKVALVDALRADGGVIMLGDGINDAPALSRATVGIGLRGGLESGLQASSVFIASGGIAAVHNLFAGALSSRRCLRWALAWSLLYNCGGIAAAMAGWWGPWLCAIAMPASSLTIIAIALANRAFIRP
ncbi:MAG: heavy metal translocating P-type ATPase [Planctomycetota bacterium]|nr:MAG: heavy metal translocating P-type ATPase [Planctomycetota bacterium]